MTIIPQEFFIDKLGASIALLGFPVYYGEIPENVSLAIGLQKGASPPTNYTLGHTCTSEQINININIRGNTIENEGRTLAMGIEKFLDLVVSQTNDVFTREEVYNSSVTSKTQLIGRDANKNYLYNIQFEATIPEQV